MKLRLFALRFLMVRKSRVTNRNDVHDGEIRTQDGTVDRFGNPAPRLNTGGWRAAAFVLVEQVLGNLAFFAVSINLVTYMTTIMHEDTASAVKNVNNWLGTGWFAPIIAGFIADAYSGRYRGAVLSSVVFIVGGAMLTVAATVPSLRPAQCGSRNSSCEHASVGQGAYFYAGLYIMCLGSGGLQGTILPFGADQFDEEDEKEKKQKSSFFNWFYQAILVGSLIASTIFIYVQDNSSWGLGWGLSCGAQILGTCVFMFGAPTYRYHIGINCFLLMYGGWMMKIRCLDKAAIVTATDKEENNVLSANPWHLCTVTQVEELKFLLRVIPISCSSVMYSTCYNQLTTLFVTQGYTMDRKLGSLNIPAASLSAFESLSVLFWIVIYDRLLVPFLRKRTGNTRGMSTLTRIGVGLGMSILAMVIAAGVAIERLRIVEEHGMWDERAVPVPMSVFWEIPQYFVMGASEVFTYVGLLEFFYDQAPDSIRTVGTSISMLTNAFGSFFASALVTIVNSITKQGGSPGWIPDNLNRGRIDLFFWLLAALSSLNLLAFVVSAHYYEYTVTEGPIMSSSAEETLAHDPKDDQTDKSLK